MTSTSIWNRVKRHRVAPIALAIVALVIVVIAGSAFSFPNKDSLPNEGSSHPKNDASLAALSDSVVGVTPTTIKVGIALDDLDSLLGLTGGSATTSNNPLSTNVQHRAWQAFIDNLNSKGGINGRKIVPYYIKMTDTNVDSQRPACLQWTETEPVFAVLGLGTLSAFGGPGSLCVTNEHHTLLIADSEQIPASYLTQAKGLLIDAQANATRSLTDFALALNHYGDLSGRKLGFIVDQGTEETNANQGMIPTLKSIGHKIAYTAAVSLDSSQGPAQAVADVAQMRAAGVNTVLAATSFFNLSAFVNAANQQGWHPQYLISNYSSGDNATYYQGMPSSFNGAIAITYQPFKPSAAHPEDPVTRDCFEQYNKLTNSDLKPTPDTQYILAECSAFQLFTAAAKAAGPNLTGEKVSAAIQAPGFSVKMYGLGGSWGSGKTDYDNVVRPIIYGPTNGSSQICTYTKTECFNNDGPAWTPPTATTDK
jgi:hypothetical protein